MIKFGKHTLYLGDCLEILKEIPDSSVDLVLTDPPYNISQKGKTIDRSKFNAVGYKNRNPLKLDFGDWDNMERQEFLDFTKKWLIETIRVLKDGGTLISFFSKEDISYLGWVGTDNGMRTRSIFTWHKTNPVPSIMKVNYLSSCEFAYIGSKGTKSWTFNFDLQKTMHNFFETSNASAYKETEHPTEKPVEMFQHFIKIHTNENDTVLDCFMGSGTTGVACEKLNRNFIGIEKDEKYFKIAQDRIKKEYNQLKLF